MYQHTYHVLLASSYINVVQRHCDHQRCEVSLVSISLCLTFTFNSIFFGDLFNTFFILACLVMHLELSLVCVSLFFLTRIFYPLS